MQNSRIFIVTLDLNMSFTVRHLQLQVCAYFLYATEANKLVHNVPGISLNQVIFAKNNFILHRVSIKMCHFIFTARPHCLQCRAL